MLSKQNQIALNEPPVALVDFDRGISNLEKLLYRVFSRDYNQFHNEAVDTCNALSDELANLYSQFGQGVYRDVYMDNSTVWKVPNVEKVGIESLGAAWNEIVGADINYHSTEGVPLAETNICFHKSGIPIIVMERVCPDYERSQEFFAKSKAEQKDFASKVDIEEHLQVGEVKRTGNLAIYDLSTMPSGMKSEFENHSLYWPGKTRLYKD